MLLEASAGVLNQPSRMVARAGADRRDRRAEHHAPRQGAYAASATVGPRNSAASRRVWRRRHAAPVVPTGQDVSLSDHFLASATRLNSPCL